MTSSVTISPILTASLEVEVPSPATTFKGNCATVADRGACEGLARFGEVRADRDGMQVAAPQLFYDFCLDDYVPGDHLLRRIDRLFDLENVRGETRPFYSTIGRPSIDPDLMLRDTQIVSYCMGIRSERRLCGEWVSIFSALSLVLSARSGR